MKYLKDSRGADGTSDSHHTHSLSFPATLLRRVLRRICVRVVQLALQLQHAVRKGSLAFQRSSEGSVEHALMEMLTFDCAIPPPAPPALLTDFIGSVFSSFDSWILVSVAKLCFLGGLLFLQPRSRGNRDRKLQSTFHAREHCCQVLTRISNFYWDSREFLSSILWQEFSSTCGIEFL